MTNYNGSSRLWLIGIKSFVLCQYALWYNADEGDVMVDSEKDLETYVLKALASMQKIGKPPGNILIETSSHNISLIIRSNSEPIHFGDWTAITISHKDFLLLGGMIESIIKNQGRELK